LHGKALRKKRCQTVLPNAQPLDRQRQPAIRTNFPSMLKNKSAVRPCAARVSAKKGAKWFLPDWYAQVIGCGRPLEQNSPLSLKMQNC
jgi:hypothetical protein